MQRDNSSIVFLEYVVSWWFRCVYERVVPSKSVSKYEYNAVIAEYAWNELSFLFQRESVADNSSINRDERSAQAMGWQFWIFNCWLD